MRLSGASARPWAFVVALVALVAPAAAAEASIMSDSLQSCAGNATIAAGFTAKLFKVAFFPANHSLFINVEGYSSITGNVTADVDVTAYGYQVYKKKLSGCNVGLQGLCPMTSGQIPIKTNINDISPDVISQIPSIAYSVPDIDGQVQIRILRTGTDQELACIQAQLTNGKTVYTKGVGWATAIIAGLALLTSAIVAGLGHANTAVHIAANAMSLFGFFQHQALIGMTAVPLPPIVSSWTQNFQWSMGIIHLGFIQDIATWYQRATGGIPSNILGRLSQISVNVQKRSLDAAPHVSRAAAYMTERAAKFVPAAAGPASQLAKRISNTNANSESGGTVLVKGIQRVGFRANIELTNIFMTGYIFFLVFVLLIVLCVTAFKLILEGLAKAGKIKGDKFQDFRNGWTTVLKGILFRIVLLGFPQMVVLGLWELVVQDSSGEMALAVVTLFTFLAMLAWACFKVVRLARRSISMHKNPAYILYSDPVNLHKWGFLYVQYKATYYWFVIPWLGYTLLFGMFVAFAQDSDVVQAVAILILEAGLLVGASIMHPWMDKKTNGFNISIAAVNFVSSIFLLFFTGIFGLPGLVNGIMGILFFAVNAIMALVLLILILVATGFAIFSKNPDIRYERMRDDRGSFIKSQTNLNTELDALGATARGEGKAPFRPREIDTESMVSYEAPHPGAPGYSKEASSTHYTGYDGSPFASPHDGNVSGSNTPVQRSRYNTGPWQRGAGYD